MTDAEKALLWEKEWPETARFARLGRAYRAGAAASAERIKVLEARVAELEDMASRYLIQMSDMLTRLEERHPEDFVWLKDGDEPTDEDRYGWGGQG